MTHSDTGAAILQGRTSLDIEFGSTRIKLVLMGEDHRIMASGSHQWHSRYEDGLWTYSLEEIRSGLQDGYAALARSAREQYGLPLETVGSIGVSAMMHGYLAFDGEGALLAPFRTWQNTNAAPAARELSALLSFNIPVRWSIAHLEQAILNGEEHVPRIRTLTTLAGYIHWQLTGEKVLGIGDASGMFPVSAGHTYDREKLARYEAHNATRNLPWHLEELLPRVLTAGEDAGTLTPEGALLLDPTGTLRPGIPFCPPEGDAGSGMVATNCVRPRTCNVSAGTSFFAMAVLDAPLSRPYPEIDIVTTPAGDDVAMVHGNNGTGDLDAWAELLRSFLLRSTGTDLPRGRILDLLFDAAMEGEPDCGGLYYYNCINGEPLLGLSHGCALLARTPGVSLTLPGFARAQLSAILAPLAAGMRLLTREGVCLEEITGHGGFFVAGEPARRIMAAALNVPVSVTDTASEGGAWGMALLAEYRRCRRSGETLFDYLQRCVFAHETKRTSRPDPAEHEGFLRFLVRYEAAAQAQAVFRPGEDRAQSLGCISTPNRCFTALSNVIL